MCMTHERLVMKEFLPNIDNATYQIDGTRLNALGGMDMCNAVQYKLTNECTFSNVYEHFDGDTQKGLVVESHLTTALQNKLSFEKKYHILEKALRILINMVPDPRSDEDFAALSTTFFGSSNYYQPQEALGGHCVIEFVLGNNTVVENSDWRSPQRNKNSFFDKLFVKDADKKTKLRNDCIKYNVLVAPYMEVHSDLTMRNCIELCLDFDKPQSMYEKANFFLDIIFS